MTPPPTPYSSYSDFDDDIRDSCCSAWVAPAIFGCATLSAGVLLGVVSILQTKAYLLRIVATGDGVKTGNELIDAGIQSAADSLSVLITLWSACIAELGATQCSAPSVGLKLEESNLPHAAEIGAIIPSWITMSFPLVPTCAACCLLSMTIWLIGFLGEDSEIFNCCYAGSRNKNLPAIFLAGIAFVCSLFVAFALSMFYSKSISAQVNGIKSIEAGILFIYMTSTGIALLIIGFIACMVWYFSEPSADEGRLVWKNGPASSKAASYRGRDALWGDQAHAVVK